VSFRRRQRRARHDSGISPSGSSHPDVGHTAELDVAT
jgi:hypothetical protein